MGQLLLNLERVLEVVRGHDAVQQVSEEEEKSNMESQEVVFQATATTAVAVAATDSSSPRAVCRDPGPGVPVEYGKPCHLVAPGLREADHGGVGVLHLDAPSLQYRNRTGKQCNILPYCRTMYCGKNDFPLFSLMQKEFPGEREERGEGRVILMGVQQAAPYLPPSFLARILP